MNDLLQSVLDATRRPFVREGERLVLRADAGVVSVRVVAEAEPESVLFRCPLVHYRKAGEPSVEALRHFARAVSSRVPLVRAMVHDSGLDLVGEIAAGAIQPDAVEKVLSALEVAARLSKRECRALLDPLTARHYLQFHGAKEKLE